MSGPLHTPAGVSLVTNKQEAKWMERIPYQQCHGLRLSKPLAWSPMAVPWLRQPLTTEAQVQSQISPFGLCGGQNDSETVSF